MLDFGVSKTIPDAGPSHIKIEVLGHDHPRFKMAKNREKREPPKTPVYKPPSIDNITTSLARLNLPKMQYDDEARDRKKESKPYPVLDVNSDSGPKFTCFTLLPTELQLKIWRYTIFGSERTIHIHSFERQIRRIQRGLALYRLPPQPAILHVNTEARKEGLKYFQLIPVRRPRLTKAGIRAVELGWTLDADLREDTSNNDVKICTSQIYFNPVVEFLSLDGDDIFTSPGVRGPTNFPDSTQLHQELRHWGQNLPGGLPIFQNVRIGEVDWKHICLEQSMSPPFNLIIRNFSTGNPEKLYRIIKLFIGKKVLVLGTDRLLDEDARMAIVSYSSFLKKGRGKRRLFEISVEEYWEADN